MRSILAIFSLVFILLFPGPSSIAAEKMIFSFGALVGNQSPVWVAKEMGFFAKHGIDAELIFIVGGMISTQSMVAGEVQMGAIGPSSVIRASLSGADLVYVFGLTDTAGWTLVTQKEITDVRQLRGKRVGIGRFGGGPDFAVRSALERYGLKLDRDVAIIQMGVGDMGRLSALQAKAIESIVITPPLTLSARKQGFNLLLRLSEVVPDIMGAGVATTRSFIRKNPKAVEGAVKALVDACKYIRSNESGTSNIIQKYMRITDRDVLQEYYREVITKEITTRYYLNVNAVRRVIEEEGLRDPKVAKAKPEDFIDHRFLDRLKKEGYF